MEISRYEFGEGDLTARLITSYNFQVFDLIFKYEKVELESNGFSVFVEPDFIKNIYSLQSRKMIDENIILPILKIDKKDYNPIFGINNGAEKINFDKNNSLDVYEVVGTYGIGNYVRKTKIFEVQKHYSLFEKISINNQYSDIDDDMYLFILNQWDYLKQQKAIKPHMHFSVVDEKTLIHFNNILKIGTYEARK